MKILVAGIGYIGSGLVKELLNKGHEVIAVDNGFGRTLDAAIEFCAHPNFSFIKGDLGSEQTLDKLVGKFQVAVLSHGLVGEPLCNKYPYMAFEANADSVRAFCAKFNNPVILTSTGSVYGAVDGICTEETPTNCISHYAKTKLTSEQYVKEHNPHVIYRFATAFGLSTSSFRLDLLVNDLAYQAWKNKTITLFQPDFRRTFCHVRDLVKSLVYAIENFSKLEGQVYNVGKTENNWSKRKLADFIQKKTNCSIFFADSGYKDTDARDYEVNFDKLSNKGWQAKISIEQGIDEMLKAFPMLDLRNNYNFVG